MMLMLSNVFTRNVQMPVFSLLAATVVVIVCSGTADRANSRLYSPYFSSNLFIITVLLPE